jgi:hypothetical protein
MPENKQVLLSTAYLAPIQYYCKLCSYNKVFVEVFENYSKQSYRNRCNIIGANGPHTLSIPIKKSSELKILTKDVEIDYSTRWQSVHWRAIESAYRSSPFFIYYADDIEAFYRNRISSLVEFNNTLQSTILELASIKTDIHFTTNYMTDMNGFDDFREVIHPKPRLNKPDIHFQPASYYQVFENKFGFLPNTSVIDLLFNMGPSLHETLVNSSTSK